MPCIHHCWREKANQIGPTKVWAGLSSQLFLMLCKTEERRFLPHCLLASLANQCPSSLCLSSHAFHPTFPSPHHQIPSAPSYNCSIQSFHEPLSASFLLQIKGRLWKVKALKADAWALCYSIQNHCNAWKLHLGHHILPSRTVGHMDTGKGKKPMA